MLVKGGGTIVNKELAPGQVLRVTSGSLVAFESSIQYEVGMIPGIRNVMFGGEGLFVTTLTGPGQVWLQGMPPDRMIAEIARRVPGPGIGLGIPIGLGGGGGDAGTATDTPGGVDPGAAGVGGEAAVAAAGGEEAVAATDAAIEADRQATVAASGMDSDSQSALFGDTVSTSDTAASTTSASSVPPDLNSSSSSSSSSDSFSQETTFGGDSDFADQSTFSSETTFQDDFDDSFTDQQQDGDMFDDSAIEGLGGGEEAAESGSSVLSFLWDLVSGRDD